MKTQRKYAGTERYPVIAWQRTGSGPAFVLLHGFPENGDLWSGIVPALAPHFTLIIPDLPGAGESTYAGPHLTMEDMAAQVAEILRLEEIPEAVIAGHSMGGYTAMAFADRYPGKVTGLALVHSGAHADDEQKKETRSKSIALLRKGGKDAFVRQMIPGLFSAGYRAAHPGVVARQTERGLQLDAGAMIAFYEAMMSRPDRTEVLRRAAFPVQWIIGREDTTTPAAQALQQAAMPDVSFIALYEDCGHMSMFEQPAQLAGDLLEFGRYGNNR